MIPYGFSCIYNYNQVTMKPNILLIFNISQFDIHMLIDIS